VEDARAGDAAAFGRLARRVEPLVRRWALVRTGDPVRADEVVQSVLLRAHGHLSDFRGEARLETWLYRITANEAATLERKRGRPTMSLDRLGEEAVPVGEAAPAAAGADRADEIDALYAREVAGLVRAFFRELPDRQRQVFDLVDLQGHAAAEIAEILELSPSTVRVTLLRARRQIRARILEMHPELEEGYGRGL